MSSVNRVILLDKAAQDNSVWNAQRNLNSFIAKNVTSGQTAAVVSESAQTFLSNIIPSHRWIVYAYPVVFGAAANSWRCMQKTCFISVNASATYNMLVIGYPYSAYGNPDLLATFTPQTTTDAFKQANTQADSVYSANLCLGGVFSTYGSQL